MSRFFNILKEAGRSGSNSDTAARAVEPWPALEFETDAGAGSGAANQPPEAEAASPLQDLLESFPEPPAPESGFLGTETEVSLDQKARLITRAAEPVVAEHYRRLRTKLLQERANKPFRSLVVASPNPQEGKTLTVLNLGLIFAMLPSFRVLVVDGDLRKGSLGKWLGVDHQPGLVSLLEGGASLEQVVFKCDDIPLHFVVRGKSDMRPGELLNAPQLKTFLRRMAEHYDLVLVDSPPVNMVTDAQLLAAGCDGVLLIARAYSTTCKHFQKMVQELASFRIVGAVLNGGEPHSRRRYKGYY